MRDALLAAGALAGLVVALVLLRRRRAGAEDRRRAKSAADANRARHESLPPAEQEHADAIHKMVEQTRTGELPRFTERRKPTVLAVVRSYRHSAKHGRRKLPKSRPRDALSGPLPPVLEQTVMLPAAPPKWELESFTTDVWKARERMGIKR